MDVQKLTADVPDMHAKIHTRVHKELRRHASALRPVIIDSLWNVNQRLKSCLVSKLLCVCVSVSECVYAQVSTFLRKSEPLEF